MRAVSGDKSSPDQRCRTLTDRHRELTGRAAEFGRERYEVAGDPMPERHSRLARIDSERARVEAELIHVNNSLTAIMREAFRELGI
jgi:hypothetical protein